MIRKDTRDDIKDATDAAMTAVQSVLRDGKDTGADLADRIVEKAQAARDTVIETASDIAADAATRVKDVATSAGDMASQTMESAKRTIADEGHRLAQTLRSNASDSGKTVQARVLDAMAGGVESVADSVRGRSLSALYADVQTFARRNPGAFVAGAAVIGFALVRLARSGTSPADGKLWENRS